MNIIDEINRWWPVFSIIATLACGWCLYQLSRRFVSKGEHEVVKAEQEIISERLDVLERRMETVPDGKTLHNIQLSLEELRGDMKAIGAHMDGVETSVAGLKNEISMLVQHHLENSR